MASFSGARFTQSIFARVLLFVAVVSIIITGALTANSIRGAASLTTGVISDLGSEVTGLIAEQSGGALKFRKADELQSRLAS
jgi:hypothetical protein